MKNLLAETFADNGSVARTGSLIDDMSRQTDSQTQLSPELQDLIVLARNDLNLTQGEEIMWIGDVPTSPASNSPTVMVAEASRGTKQTLQTEQILGICQTIQGRAEIRPMSDADIYMFRFRQKDGFSSGANAKIIQQPKNGMLSLSPNSDPKFNKYDYTPNPSSSNGGRDDYFVMSVEKDGVRVEVRYYIIIESVDDAHFEYCDKQLWKISADSPQATIDLASLQRNVALSALLSDASQAVTGFADLPGAAVGQTTGTTITFDTNAAGYNWFIDYTPAENSEFLPTANPNEWIAKADSEAAGKMDMLSVLLHEYGHALGIEHSASAHDHMATTLQPGVRRLPSADELALMAKLAGDLRLELAGDSTPSPDTPSSPLPSVPLGGSLGLALLGRLRSNRFGGWNVAVDSASLIPQYAVAANPKLSNTEFAGEQVWSTTGDVRFQDGAATLTEAAASQTRLNQVFIVGENDRFLSFTLADTALDDADQAPDDAFEVALLDANTGASLLGGTGLTRNDAFLNLQADGNEHKSQAVTSIRNADGSRTYLVDLAGIPAGTAVNLAFDLIGFGKGAAAASSHLTIRDLRIGVPQTKDDSATLAEDGVTTIAALANDLNAQQPGFAPIIVDAPAHGQITINADGTFSFAPEKDWHGEDHFSYKLSDGHVDSNRLRRMMRRMLARTPR
ncbi:MAG: Ig-like domain-containing protein [Rhodocyclales bacterium]|nr:Ig-like domain-containing protein [Rhodocyclales bacterium]